MNSGKYYKADAIIMGGDITGKFLVPIVRQKDYSFVAYLPGEERHLKKDDEVKKLEEYLRRMGYYYAHLDSEQFEEVRVDPKKIDGLFLEESIKRLNSWIKAAEERLEDTGIKCFVQPGNDDRYEIDDALNRSEIMVNPNNKVVEIDERHEMFSLGYSNITPWNCPRDISEEEFAEKIDSLVSLVQRIEKCIFNIHCPPFGTNIDLAPNLDENLTPILSPSGGFEMIPVGSKAVRNAIEKYQPFIGLHGHIHESRGTSKIGQTLCVNPGSEYPEGILHGFLADITENKINDHLLLVS